VLGQFTGEEETDSGLDLSRSDGGSLVVVGQTGSLSGDALEDVVDERVHDRHSLGGDTGIGVDLLQHLVDVDGERFLSAVFALLLSVGDTDSLLGLSGLLDSFAS